MGHRPEAKEIRGSFSDVCYWGGRACVRIDAGEGGLPWAWAGGRLRWAVPSGRRWGATEGYGGTVHGRSQMLTLTHNSDRRVYLDAMAPLTRGVWCGVYVVLAASGPPLPARQPQSEGGSLREGSQTSLPAFDMKIDFGKPGGDIPKEKQQKKLREARAPASVSSRPKQPLWGGGAPVTLTGHCWRLDGARGWTWEGPQPGPPRQAQALVPRFPKKNVQKLRPGRKEGPRGCPPAQMRLGLGTAARDAAAVTRCWNRAELAQFTLLT